MGQRTGAATSSVSYSPARKKRQAAKRAAQDRRWAAKAGPVTVRRIGDPEPVNDQLTHEASA